MCLGNQVNIKRVVGQDLTWTLADWVSSTFSEPRWLMVRAAIFQEFHEAALITFVEIKEKLQRYRARNAGSISRKSFIGLGVLFIQAGPNL